MAPQGDAKHAVCCHAVEALTCDTHTQRHTTTGVGCERSSERAVFGGTSTPCAKAQASSLQCRPMACRAWQCLHDALCLTPPIVHMQHVSLLTLPAGEVPDGQRQQLAQGEGAVRVVGKQVVLVGVQHLLIAHCKTEIPAAGEKGKEVAAHTMSMKALTSPCHRCWLEPQTAVRLGIWRSGQECIAP